MSARDTVPVRLAALPRRNPLAWSEPQVARGVFVAAGSETASVEAPDRAGDRHGAFATWQDEALALLGAPSLEPLAAPRLPEDFRATPALRRWFEALSAALEDATAGHPPRALRALETFSEAERLAIAEVLGQGEVSGETTVDGVRWTLRESLLAGVWRVSGDDGTERIEIGRLPAVVEHAALSLAPAPVPLPADPPDVMNGPAILTEISERAAAWAQQPGEDNHVLNLTLLPTSGGDQMLLTTVLGRADLTLTSGGFGTCHLMATTVRHVWAVQYVNALGQTILDTIEIGGVPQAACAAREDFEDSARRLSEILEAYL